jgi:hypothetical protein
MSQSISGAASEYVSTVGDYADKTRRTIVEGSEHLAEQARSTMQTTIDRVLREQPLAVAVAGVAAGALLAAAFPASSIERETLGPAGERLSEAATKTGRQLKEAAAAAGEHAMDAAEERGLTSGGLKEMASEVADTFGKTFSGEMKVKTGSSSGPTDPQPTTADPASQGFASDRTRAGRDSSGGSGSTGGSSNSG